MSQKEQSKSDSTVKYLPQQMEAIKKGLDVYTPYLGTGTLGGISDLEEQSVNMLRNANVWEPMTQASEGLLTGTLGAEKISPEKAAQTFESSVVKPTQKQWSETWKPEIKEEYAGPGYWGGARAKAVSDAAGDVADWMGTERSNWMWNVDEANRQIDEAKAGRSLSALGTVPGALTGWTSSLFGTGQAAREVMNQITDPSVLNALQMFLGMPMGQTTTNTASPSPFQQVQNWGSMIGGAGEGLSGLKDAGGLSNLFSGLI